MVEENTSNFGTAFTVSIEARGRTTTGISAADRAATVLTAIDPATKPVGPATVPATCSRCGRSAGGVLKRAGQTEASVDLARIAGLEPVGRPLRDHERGRHDGARAGPREVLRAARARRWSRSPTSSATG